MNVPLLSDFGIKFGLIVGKFWFKHGCNFVWYDLIFFKGTFLGQEYIGF